MILCDIIVLHHLMVYYIIVYYIICGLSRPAPQSPARLARAFVLGPCLGCLFIQLSVYPAIPAIQLSI